MKYETENLLESPEFVSNIAEIQEAEPLGLQAAWLALDILNAEYQRKGNRNA